MAKKAGVTTRKRKTKANAPGADGAGSEGTDVGHNSNAKKELTPDEKQELFLHHREGWNAAMAKVKAAKKIFDDVCADIKADGFTKKQMQIADQLADVKGEAKVKSEVEERLQVAQWLGHPMGAQMDLFMQPDRRPAVETAFEIGKVAGMEGRVRKPPYAPEVPQYEEWMKGWYEGQKALSKGFEKRSDEAATSH